MKREELTCDIKIYDSKNDEVYTEKSWCAFHKTAQKVMWAGTDCEKMCDNVNYQDTVVFSPIVLGKIDDYMSAQMMMKYLLGKNIKRFFRSFIKPHCMLILHDHYNDAEVKVYLDLLYQCGFKEVILFSENIMKKPEDTSWEVFIKDLLAMNKKIRYAIEITKENKEEYVQYMAEQLVADAKSWGIEKEKVMEMIEAVKETENASSNRY